MHVNINTLPQRFISIKSGANQKSRFIQRAESRILDARRMLRYTDRSIDQIAYELCFSSQPHFQKVLRKQTGMTPNEYRRKHAVI